MSVGYKITGTSVKSYSSSGFNFNINGNYSYIPSGSTYTTYVKYIADSNGLIYRYNTGSSASISYPSAQSGVKSGTVYRKNSSAAPSSVGSIEQFNYYNVSASAGSGVSSVSGAGRYDEGTSCTLTATKDSGYGSVTWSCSDGTTSTGNSITFTVSGDVSYTATASANVYTITLDANGDGASVTPTTVTCASNASVQLPTPTRENYAFNGWYTGRTSGTKVNSSSYTPTSNKTLYARWEYSPDTVTVTFHNADGVDPQTVNRNASIVMPTPTRSDATCDGWFASESGATVVAQCGDMYTVTDNIDLYAHWTAGFNVEITNESTSVGHVYLTDNSTGATVANDDGGTLSCLCVSNTTYTLSATISDSSYESAKIVVGGSYTYLPYTFTAYSGGSLESSVLFSQKPRHTITILNTDTYENVFVLGSTVGQTEFFEQDITFFTSWNNGARLEGQKLKKPSKFWIYDHNDHGTVLKNGSLYGNSFTLQKSLFNRDIDVKVEFEVVKWKFFAKSSDADYGTVTCSPSPGTYEDGTSCSLSYSISNSLVYSFDGWYKNGNLASTAQSLVLSLQEDTSYEARFSLQRTDKQSVLATYGDGVDKSLGCILADGNQYNDVYYHAAVSHNNPFGQKVTVEAIIYPGSEFVGWFSDAACTTDNLLSDNPTYIFAPCNPDATKGYVYVYAKFIPGDVKIKEWEGSSTNKTMTWRSKTYAASRPFCPSACRVDTLGYPVEKLTVDMFSSPDSEAKTTGHAELTNIASQDSRRLPIRRPERFMQVEVKSDDEVDAVYIGTSMGGLAV